MKVLTFFNEKGGSGKTLLTTLMASWLAYSEKKRVCVIDMECPDFRIKSFREMDIKQLGDTESPLYRFFRANRPPERLFDIFPVGREINHYDTESLRDIYRQLVEIANSGKYDYMLIDFPGGFSKKTPVSVLTGLKFIDLVITPMDTDAQTRKAALLVADAVKRAGVSCYACWNRVTAAELKGRLLDAGENIFNEYGIGFLKTRVRHFEKAKRDTDGKIFVRNTVCWPQRYVEMNCRELPAFFQEVKGILDSIESE